MRAALRAWRSHRFEENSVWAGSRGAMKKLEDFLALRYGVVLRLNHLQFSIALLGSLFRRDGLLGLIIIVFDNHENELWFFHARPPSDPAGCLGRSLQWRLSCQVRSGSLDTPQRKHGQFSVSQCNWSLCEECDRFR